MPANEHRVSTRVGSPHADVEAAALLHGARGITQPQDENGRSKPTDLRHRAEETSAHSHKWPAVTVTAIKEYPTVTIGSSPREKAQPRVVAARPGASSGFRPCATPRLS
eukprot:1779223-Prymnesium_polylepis.1